MRAVQFLERAIRQGKCPIVSDLVVSEAYFALVSHYGVAKRDAGDALLEMFERGPIKASPGGCAVEVLRAMESSPRKPGLVDRLIHAEYASKLAPMVTIERASRKLPNVVVLEG